MVKLEQVVAATEAHAACLAAVEKLRARHDIAMRNVLYQKKQLDELESETNFTANVDLTKHKFMLRDLQIYNQDLRTQQRLLDVGEIELTLLSDILKVTKRAYFATKELVVLATGNV